jgi:hypothetical protein
LADLNCALEGLKTYWRLKGKDILDFLELIDNEASVNTKAIILPLIYSTIVDSRNIQPYIKQTMRDYYKIYIRE